MFCTSPNSTIQSPVKNAIEANVVRFCEGRLADRGEPNAQKDRELRQQAPEVVPGGGEGRARCCRRLGAQTIWLLVKARLNG